MDDYVDREGAGCAPLQTSELNASEAANLSYIVSHRLSRNEDWRLASEDERSAAAMSELASRIADRIEELALRLAGEQLQSELSQDTGA
jgi:hypothetical protein